MPEIVSLEEQARQQWADWREKAVLEGVEAPDDPRFVAAALRVWEGSEFVARICLRHPAILSELVRSGLLTAGYRDGELSDQLRACLDGVEDEAALGKRLRLFRRRQMVRIIWRDIAGWAGLEETLEDLSALADACVDQAVGWLYDWACRDTGVPRDAAGQQQRLLVLGMGKLGARELNLSSDIDLIFAYPEHGQTDGSRVIENEQFFVRLCHRLIDVLSAQRTDGFVFRVDARLRPFGDSGPLAMNFESMEDYYESQAREWERYAMIKARVISGDATAGERFRAMIKPFVYRRYLDFGAIESLREMKELISGELKRKGIRDNIKLGPGGIREVEFIGQTFQLIRGGRETGLQRPGIVEVLGVLAEKRYLPPSVVDELISAYRFLRIVENRLQAWRDCQIHSLPEKEIDRLRLARAMGYSVWDVFLKDLNGHRERVQNHFDQLFAAPKSSGSGGSQTLGGLWPGTLDDKEAAARLEKIGFRRPDVALERISVLRNSHACRSLGTKGQERMDQLVPLLLEAVGSSENPEQTLDRTFLLLEAIARRTSYIALLVENPVVLSHLVHLSSVSSWIARLLTRHPLLLDELLDPRRLYAPLHRQDLRSELQTLLERTGWDDLEQQMERMRQFAQSNRLRVAAADITNNIPLMVVSDYLTEIAEVVIDKVMELGWRHLMDRHGKPMDVYGSDTGFAVLGYGKLGGIELGYGSDLDLVFLHGNEDPNGMTGGDRPVANDVFYVRLGQRMIHMLTTHTPSGVLYEVDMRLRPSGASGLLVSSVSAFSDYQAKEAWTWEHQALLRARVVAGDALLADRFNSIRREVLSRERDPVQLRNEVVDMRERMRDQLDKSGNGWYDVKQGPGGITDIEFMVQYAVLRWAHKYPDLLDWTDNIRLLETLARHSLLGGQAAAELADAYRAFRASYHRNTLRDEPGLVPDERLLDERKLVMEMWRRQMAE